MAMSFSEFGDGREERMAATELEMRLRADPEITRRREAYQRKVALAHEEAKRIGQDAVIERLMASCPSYLRHLLESEGEGALARRYANTFWKNMEILQSD